MKTLKNNLITLRRKANLTQSDLSKKLNITSQTISKWENGLSLPDITILPLLSEIFQVTTDQLLGITPLEENCYKRRDKNTSDYRNRVLQQFIATRQLFWNDDYLEFFIKKVLNITQAVKVAEINAGNGIFANQILKYLPVGSTYTGFEKSSTMIKDGTDKYTKDHISLLPFNASKDLKDEFDVVICQSYLRNHSKPLEAIEHMIQLTKTGGIIIGHEDNKPFENHGLLLGNTPDHSFEKSTFLKTMWQHEEELEGRDYRIGLKLPILFKHAGLVNIESRMNDHVDILLGDITSEEKLDLLNKYYELTSITEDGFLDFLLQRGLSRFEALRYIELYTQRKTYMSQDYKHVELVHYSGLMLTWGIKI